MLSSRIELLEAELDDAWMRDNGPIFVRDAQRTAWRWCSSASTAGASHDQPYDARLAACRS